MSDVLAVTGAGAIGTAVAARAGRGRTVVLGDVDAAALSAAEKDLAGAGLDVVAIPLDVTDAISVQLFAAEAAARGPVAGLAHAAGVAPGAASAPRVLAVGLVGALRVLEAFAPLVRPGGAALLVAGAAGHHPPRMPADHEEALGIMSADDLAEVPWAGPAAFPDPRLAAAFTQRAVHLRVRAEAAAWAARGARLNSVSPGAVPAADVARAAAFLLGPGAASVTGTDLLLAGGVLTGAARG